MGAIFISHSSRNNDRAVEIRQWLGANGWDDVFLDLDPERGIVAGQRWKEALQQAAHRCELVLALVSPEWLASGWCKSELDAARLMGKKTIVALIGVDKSQVPLDLSDEQWVDLTGDPNAWVRLKEGLKRAGLDPASFSFEPGRRPYPGFAFLEEDDAAIFFGRDAQIVRGLDKMRGLVRTGVERMLVILGASGSGKSSFLRAGLWPRLKRDDRSWLPLPIIRPERAVLSGQFGLAQALQSVMNAPAFVDEIRKQDLPRSRAGIQEFIETAEDGLARIFAALASIARVPGLSGEAASPPTIVLAVDQGEELFNEEGGGEARRFIAMLTRTLQAGPGLLALVVMRSDAFPQLQNEPNLAQLAKDTFTLDMMLGGSYGEVIEGPARLVQPNPLKIDPELAEALLADLTGQDALPLLAFTLAYLYERYAVDNELTMAGYQKLGRLKGVIDSTVTEAFAEGAARGELPKDAQRQLELVRSAFIPNLARVNAAGQFVRRVAVRSEIPPAAWPLIDRFAERRLLIKDRRKIAGEDVDVVEVVHEALLREWRDLHEALLAQREFLAAKGQLEQDVAEWRAASETSKSGALLSGNKLLRARDWLVTRPQDLTAEERKFIKASSDQELQQRRRRRVAVVAAFVLISASAIFAAIEARIADTEKNRAEENTKIAQAEKRRADDELRKAQRTQSLFLADLAGQQISTGNPGNAVLLALEALPDDAAAVVRPYVPEAELRLDGAWRDLRERSVMIGHHGPVWGAAFSPDGKRVVTVSEDKTARLWDAATGKPIGEPLEGHGSKVSSVAFSPDGMRIVTASEDKTARLWNSETGKPIGEPLKGHESYVSSAAFSPDGKRIVTASWDKTARLWNADNGSPIGAPLTGYSAQVSSAAFSPDGERIVTAGDTIARLWNAETGNPIGEPLEGHEFALSSAAFSPDGKWIVTASEDETARIWNAETGKQVRELKGHQGPVRSAAYRPDGKRIVTAGDTTARLWNAETGEPIGKPLRGHEEPVLSAAFSPDGKRIVTTSADKTARLWDAEPAEQIGVQLKDYKSSVRSAVFSPDGKRVLTAGGRSARLWNAETREPIGEPISHQGDVKNAAFRPDGKRIVTASTDGMARLWEVDTGRQIGEPLKGHSGSLYSVAFSPDGRRILAAGDRTAWLWDAETGRPIGEPLVHDKGLWSAAFSRDGKRIVTASEDTTAWLWAADTGEPTGARLKGHKGGVHSAAFAPDGRRVVTASEDGTARLWDAETGRPIGEPLKGHEDRLWSAVFSPDGRRVLTAAWDNTARLWDAETGKPIAEPLTGPEMYVYSAAFSPDGKRIITGTDRTARLWSVFADTQDFVLHAKAAIPRCLTAAQRTAFFLAPEPPLWCIELEKWPYDTRAWKQWLADHRAGKNPPLPAAP